MSGAVTRTNGLTNGTPYYYRIAPLLSELLNGDEVHIVTAEGQAPPAAWESLVVTGKARAAIRRATRDAVRAQYAELGRQIVRRAFERASKTFSDDKLKAVFGKDECTMFEMNKFIAQYLK
jgi:GTP pyrophosphokinase